MSKVNAGICWLLRRFTRTNTKHRRSNTPGFGAHSPSKAHQRRFFRLKKVRRDCAQSPDGPAACVFALILCFFQTSTKSRHVYCFHNRGSLERQADALERMQSRLNAIQRDSIHGEFRCFKHWIFHIKSISERIGGLSVPNV